MGGKHAEADAHEDLHLHRSSDWPNAAGISIFVYLFVCSDFDKVIRAKERERERFSNYDLRSAKIVKFFSIQSIEIPINIIG